MLTDAVAALASAASSALVTAMVTDGWEAVKARLSGLLGRGDSRQADPMSAKMEQSRVALLGLAGDELSPHDAVVRTVTVR